VLDDRGADGTCDDRNGVDANDPATVRVRVTPGFRQSPQARKFLRRDRLKWMPTRGARTSLDFDENGVIAITGNQIDFAASAPPVAVDDRVPGIGEELRRKVFTTPAQIIFCRHASRMAEVAVRRLPSGPIRALRRRAAPVEEQRGMSQGVPPQTM
jgi:hypothetical protein